MWLVKKNVFVVICQARSHGMSSSSTRMRISSGIASVGWVYKRVQHIGLSDLWHALGDGEKPTSFSWIATS